MRYLEFLELLQVLALEILEMLEVLALVALELEVLELLRLLALEVLELLEVLALVALELEILELLRVLALEVLELLEVLALRVLSLLLRGLLGVAAFVRVCLSPLSSCTTGTVAVKVVLQELGALPLEVLLLTSLELGVVLVSEVLVLEVLELLGLEVLSLRVLLLETLDLGVLLLETLGLEVSVLGVLLLVKLVLEELALRVLELLGVQELLVLEALHNRFCSLLHQPESDRAGAAHPTVTRLLATVVTDLSFESFAASALVVELVDFAAACRLDYAASLVAESESVCPPSVGGECALGTDVLEDRQEDLECFAAAAPHFVSMLLAPEGDPDAPDIPTPRSYAEAIAGEYSSQWQTAMDAKMASWKSTGTYVDEAPREWHDTLRTTLAALGFAPSTADPSLFLRTDTSLPPFYILAYVDDLVFATAGTEALALVKSELQKRHTCTDPGEPRSYLGLQITRDKARRTITLTQSHMVQQVLQRFGFTWSSPQHTPLATGHSLSAPPSDESVEPSGPYPELVGCLMYLMTCTRPGLAYPLGLLARYVAPGRHRKVHMDAAKRVLRYLCSTSGMGLVLGGRSPVILTGHSDASWVDDLAT
ncbi:unnamed protein product [Closterium sp. NIES-64]|nr:unnamed protein product [Closterium sp. NIES-64]